MCRLATHPLRHAFGLAFSLKHIDAKRQVAGLKGVGQRSGLGPAQARRLQQQVEV